MQNRKTTDTSQWNKKTEKKKLSNRKLRKKKSSKANEEKGENTWLPIWGMNYMIPL